ncbi:MULTISPECIES: tonB-system energizer ExbB [unclassified Pseudomonas]|jgi:biopolymer transport protein ExbB|uniref:tonB-system energizer ExbB n=1 Tax=Pseudomonas TaxID=286 RepID=UPI000D02039B|nr:MULTISPECIES: tonB-system energizer ExbB [unclassified Pseudomonas]MDR2315057.1 tonB-system energizer ExbB [Pseudomonas sp.]PRN03883.1 biopolymer transporter ExbB [Pseudomonas sp. LLC-1]PYG76251.1 outer membrane transport energization protein ExbB [Pseudomonas sp. RV120224-01c]PYG80049.1 outer membrane transport energization protein ExbB [Pseudomonas sp. RV120224-01b]
MTRTQPSASPTPSRAWRAIAALTLSLVLAPVAMADEPTANAATPAAASAPAAPATQAAPAAPAVEGQAPAGEAQAAAPADSQVVVDPATDALVEDTSLGMAHDLSPWGMYKNADIVVKIVMIGLAIASIITWTIWIAKGFELMGAKRRLRGEIAQLKKSTTLKEASEVSNKEGTLAHTLVHDALEEMRLSANAREKEGIKERVSFRLERLVHASGRTMSSGTGVLATIGSTAPFVGLFGTVWGIMNSFIGIAKTQTTNLAVVAPGIAEALLATALGLVAAIPAVVIYNVFARSIAGYKAQVSDASAQVLLLVSRDLDHQGSDRAAPHMVKVG